MKISTNCFHCSFFFTLPFFSLIFILIFSMLYLPRSISILWNWCRCFFLFCEWGKENHASFFQKALNIVWSSMKNDFGFEEYAESWENHVIGFYFAFHVVVLFVFFFYKMGCKLHVWMPKWTLSFIIFKIHVCFGFGICLFLFMILVLSYLLHPWCFF